MATSPIRYPIINGYAFSFASCSVTIDCESLGTTFELPTGGFSMINYKTERDHGEPGRGPHPTPAFKVRGQDKPSATIKFYRQVADYIRKEVLGGQGYMDRFFTITVQLAEEGSDTKTDKILGCTWGSDGSDNAKGTDPTEIEVKLDPLQVLIDSTDGNANPLVSS